MSISSALNNAASGLAASARLADTISNNVANAMTAGFGRRTTELSSLSLGGYGSGARIGGDDAGGEPVSDRRAARHGRGARRDRHAVGHLRADDGGDGRAGSAERALDARDRARDRR